MKRNLKINLICIGIFIFTFPIIYYLVCIIFLLDPQDFFRMTSEDIINVLGAVFIYPGVIVSYMLSENFCFLGKILLENDIILCVKSLTGRRGDYIFILAGMILFYGSFLIIFIILLFRKLFLQRKIKQFKKIKKT